MGVSIFTESRILSTVFLSITSGRGMRRLGLSSTAAGLSFLILSSTENLKNERRHETAFAAERESIPSSFRRLERYSASSSVLTLEISIFPFSR
jgi:hypothetical protein